VIWDVKLAGGESVINEKVDADQYIVMDGVMSFRVAGKIVFSVGVNRLISVRPR
jgi:hypothetical protein